MKGRAKVNSIWKFIVFFLLMAFVVTCNFLLFLNFISLEKEEIKNAAFITFINVLLLTLIFCVMDAIRRRQMITKPVKRIQEGIDRVIKGDFSTRIEYIYGQDSNNEFNVIITGLNQMIEELSGVETLRTDFIANVSHELKTPLTVMQNYGTLLQSPELSEEQRIQYGKAIQEQTKRLSNLVMNILKLNKLENQQIYPNVEKYDLGEQLCECMLEFESVWEEKNIEIDVDIQEEVQIQADKELLSLVWNNFYQGDTSHATKGNGLGLALVKRVIDICGGEISVSSQLGEGSTFTVKLWRNTNGEILA